MSLLGEVHHWLTDANSVEFLDLCTRKFHEKRITTLVYALDLCVTPRRDVFPLCITSREGTIYHLTSVNIPRNSYKSKFFLDIPSKNLIEVFGRRQSVHIEEDPTYKTFFSDFTRHILKRLETNWEPEIIRLYINHVKAYSHYIEKSLFSTFLKPIANLITFEKPPVSCSRRGSLSLVNDLIKDTAPKLMKMLCENHCPDSCLVTELYQTAYFEYKCEDHDTCECEFITPFFTYEAKILEYTLYHLRKAKFNLSRIFQYRPSILKFKVLFQSNPEHLLVFLNSGVKIPLKQILELQSVIFFRLYPVKCYNDYWDFPAFLETGWTNLKTREAVIVDIFGHFITWSVPHFNIYLEYLRYIWRSIPDTFITFEEMKNLMVRKFDAVEDICDQLQKREFDNFDTIHRPRSLLHYSRCILRHALICNSQLPCGISHLGLPRRLESYLKLEL